MPGHAGFHGGQRWMGAGVEDVCRGLEPGLDAEGTHGRDETGGWVDGEACQGFRRQLVKNIGPSVVASMVSSRRTSIVYIAAAATVAVVARAGACVRYNAPPLA